MDGRDNLYDVGLVHPYICLLYTSGFTMGYDTGLFMDLAAAPPTIDFQGPDGMTFYRATQLRYEANVMKEMCIRDRKNIVPEKYTDQDTESKGFYDPDVYKRQEYYKTARYHAWAAYPTTELTYVMTPAHILQLSFTSDKTYPSYWDLSESLSLIHISSEWSGIGNYNE